MSTRRLLVSLAAAGGIAAGGTTALANAPGDPLQRGSAALTAVKSSPPQSSAINARFRMLLSDERSLELALANTRQQLGKAMDTEKAKMAAANSQAGQEQSHLAQQAAGIAAEQAALRQEAKQLAGEQATLQHDASKLAAEHSAPRAHAVSGASGNGDGGNDN